VKPFYLALMAFFSLGRTFFFRFRILLLSVFFSVQRTSGLDLQEIGDTCVIALMHYEVEVVVIEYGPDVP